jgi:mevalonate pyrophosphate decarboxylase
MSKKIINAMMGTLLVLSLAGCGDALNNSQNNIQAQKISNSQRSLTAPFSDLLYGFTAIEKYVANGDYESATTLTNNLYDEFHDAILPPLTAKKGKTYAEKMDRKYDELQEAISNKDQSKISELIKENRNNLKTIAPILGVSVISSK